MRKNILFIISSIGEGGAQRVATILISYLAGYHNIWLIYFHKKENTYPVDERVNVIPFYDRPDPSDKRYEGLKNKTFAFRKNKIEQLQTEHKIDVTISFLKEPNLLNALSDVPTYRIISERNDPSGKDDAYRESMLKAAAIADRIVFQTEYTMKQFPESIRDKGVIIPNPVTPHEYRAKAPAGKIVTAGRLVEQKNHALLIRAFSIFLKTHPGYSLHIYGSGPLEDDLKAMGTELLPDGVLHFEGFRTDLLSCIEDAQQFILSSDYEGLPNVLLEAMSMGLPCISTCCSGIGEIVDDGINALLTPIGEAGALAEAMGRLANDESLRRKLSTEAAKKALQWRPQIIGSKWRDLFEGE